MSNLEMNRKQAQELKGNYQFRSPYHKSKKMLPYNVLGTISFDDDFPISIYTVEYKGYTKIDHYGESTYEKIKKLIDSGFLVKI